MHFSKVSIYNFVYTVSLVTDAPFMDTVLLDSVVPIWVFFLCCEIYVHYSLRDGRYAFIAINATAWDNTIREGPEKSGFISEFTSSVFLRKFCRGPGSALCGIFGGGKKNALIRISAWALGCTLSLWFHECSVSTFHSTRPLYFFLELKWMFTATAQWAEFES